MTVPCYPIHKSHFNYLSLRHSELTPCQSDNRVVLGTKISGILYNPDFQIDNNGSLTQVKRPRWPLNLEMLKSTGSLHNF